MWPVEEPIYDALLKLTIERNCTCAMTEATFFSCLVHGVDSEFAWLF